MPAEMSQSTPLFPPGFEAEEAEIDPLFYAETEYGRYKIDRFILLNRYAVRNHNPRNNELTENGQEGLRILNARFQELVDNGQTPLSKLTATQGTRTTRERRHITKYARLKTNGRKIICCLE